MIKQLISQDHIHINVKNKEAYSARLKIRMLFSANVLPELPAHDPAIYRRFWVIKFPIIIPPDQRDVNLDEKLQTPEELSGFLNVLLKKANNLLNNGFKFARPQTVEDTKRIWVSKADPVNNWIENECVINPNEQVTGKDLQYWYNDWAFKNSEKNVTANYLYGKIEGNTPAHKFTTREKGDNVIMFKGIVPRGMLQAARHKEGQDVL